MLPTPRIQNRFARAVDEEQLVLEPRWNDFADARNGNPLDDGRKLRSNNDELILLAAVQRVVFLGFRPNRKTILIDSTRHLRLLHDMCQIRREAVTHVDHRVGLIRDRSSNLVSRFRKEMTLHRGVSHFTGLQSFESDSRRAQRACYVNTVSNFRSRPAYGLAGAHTANHGDIDKDMFRRCRVTAGQGNIKSLACLLDASEKRLEPYPIQVTRRSQRNQEVRGDSAHRGDI